MKLEETLTSNVVIPVPLRLEERTNGMCNNSRIVKGKRVMTKLRAFCLVSFSL
jgi:hypothetical protein